MIVVGAVVILGGRLVGHDGALELQKKLTQPTALMFNK